MVGYALVLGGGGSLGVAWEIGVLSGLAAGGASLAGIERVVGTSAGSFVGSQLLSRRSPEKIGQPPDGENGAGLPEVGPGAPSPVDAAKLQEILEIWGGSERLDQETRRRVGGLANAAGGFPNAAFVPWIANGLGDAHWTAGLRTTAVDTADGSLRVFGEDSGVDLPLAVAASCAIPGLFAPVEIEGRHYMDGSVSSSTGADLLLEDRERPEQVLVVAPMCDREGPGLSRQMARCLDAELAKLGQADIAVQALTPDDEAREAFGPNLMDASRRDLAREAGLNFGRRAATTPALAAWRTANAGSPGC